ncbi:hypothetical protein ACFX2C_035770 [Malus domestica]
MQKKKEVKKWVLEKLHACFGGLNGDNYARRLDGVSDVEMFHLTSMCYAFQLDSISHWSRGVIQLWKIDMGFGCRSCGTRFGQISIGRTKLCGYGQKCIWGI